MVILKTRQIFLNNPIKHSVFHLDRDSKFDIIFTIPYFFGKYPQSLYGYGSFNLLLFTNILNDIKGDRDFLGQVFLCDTISKLLQAFN